MWRSLIINCGHCSEPIPNHDIYPDTVYSDSGLTFHMFTFECPYCDETNVFIQLDGNPSYHYYHQLIPIFPFLNNRSEAPPEVPSYISEDYHEACMVLLISPKASAALSRRCLQNLLRDVAKVKPSDLSQEIQEVLNNKSLPSQLAESIDAIRNIGNFAAHPIKSKSTGEIVDVKPTEAEWNLNVIESLFDFYYVQPAIIAKKREALNTKLNDAGKPAMK